MTEPEYLKRQEVRREEQGGLQSRKDDLEVRVAAQRDVEAQVAAVPVKVQTFLEDFQGIDVRRAKAILQGYVEAGYGTKFIFHGETIEVLENADGEPTFGDYKYTCRNGDLIPSYVSKSETTKVSFDCYATGNNDGCNKIVHCPSGQKIIDATAACNLEYGTISDDTLATVPINNIQIFRASDKVSEGKCYVARNSLEVGRKAISGIDDLDRISLGCKEHDKNGGDCHIKGTLHCR